MTHKELITKAREFATKAHEGQFRRDGVTPYITHPEAVASMVPELFRPVAWLHDVMEDCGVTMSQLVEAGFPNWVALSVDTLTRRPNEDYNDYIERVSEERIATIVKLADMEHNLSCNPSENSIRKLAIAKPILEREFMRR